METGETRTLIERPPADVFAAVADITRMGEWSPECTGGRWIGGATGPAVGASFEGDNVFGIGPLTLKRWTTVSEVTECVPGEVFEFVAEGYTTWRFEFEPHADGTTVTESFSHKPYEGIQGFVYGTVMRRSATMVKGMDETLERVKTTLES